MKIRYLRENDLNAGEDGHEAVIGDLALGIVALRVEASGSMHRPDWTIGRSESIKREEKG